MDASDLIKALQKHLARRGPSTYGECRTNRSLILQTAGSPLRYWFPDARCTRGNGDGGGSELKPVGWFERYDKSGVVACRFEI
jgi:hypothetical protein